MCPADCSTVLVGIYSPLPRGSVRQVAGEMQVEEAEGETYIYGAAVRMRADERPRSTPRESNAAAVDLDLK